MSKNKSAKHFKKEPGFGGKKKKNNKQHNDHFKPHKNKIKGHKKFGSEGNNFLKEKLNSTIKKDNHQLSGRKNDQPEEDVSSLPTSSPAFLKLQTSQQKALAFQCKNGEKWYNAFLELAELSTEGDSGDKPSSSKSLAAKKSLVSPSEAAELEAKALDQLKECVSAHSEWCHKQNASEAKWMDTVIKTGTFADRLSALQLRVQRFPVYSLSHLNSVIDSLKLKGLRESYSLLTVLQQIFIDELIPPHRKLVSFTQRPLYLMLNGNKDAKNAGRLALWAFESELKKCYTKFIQALEKLTGSAVENMAKSACKILSRLLMERSEQEQLLLSELVNKLGHPQRHVGSMVCHLLEQVVQKHPNMRLVIVSEVEQLVFRKNVGLKAHRYAVHFLSRIMLQAGEWELATKLVKIYLNLFHALTAANKGKEDEAEQQPWSRILPLLLSGLNRAFPYLKGHAEELMSEMDSLYSIVQTSKLATALRVLRLLFQIHGRNEGLPDRFYSAFYRRLLTVDTSGSLGGHQLFQLLEQVLRHDLVESRVRAFLKRVYQLALCGSPAFACASLLTAYAVLKERPALLRLKNTFDFPSSSSNSLKSKAKSKKQNHQLATAKKEKEEEPMEIDEDDEEEEHYEDVPSDGEQKDVKKWNNKSEAGNATTVSGWNWVKGGKSGKSANSSKNDPESAKKDSTSRNPTAYDPAARNPLFAGADFVPDTELYTLAKHYHPTVARFAQCLIRGEHIEYGGDPLVDFSAIRFLDRFAFKNPKKGGKEGDMKKKEGKKGKEEAAEGSDVSDAEFEALMDKELGGEFSKALRENELEGDEDDDSDEGDEDDSELDDEEDEIEDDGGEFDDEEDELGEQDEGDDSSGSSFFDDEDEEDGEKDNDEDGDDGSGDEEEPMDFSEEGEEDDDD